MPKPARIGLDYFSLDTNYFFDRRVQRLHIACGMAGVGIYVFILSRIYEKDGYYTPVDKHFYFDISILIREDETKVKEVVDYCVKTELFHIGMFRKKRILTSVEIQHRYLLVKKKGKQMLNSEYLLLNTADIESLTDPDAEKTPPPNTPCNGATAGKNDFFAAKRPQREEKGKEEKRKEEKKEKEKTLTGKKEEQRETNHPFAGKPAGGKINFNKNFNSDEHEKKLREAAIERMVENATKRQSND